MSLGCHWCFAVYRVAAHPGMALSILFVLIAGFLGEIESTPQVRKEPQEKIRRYPCKAKPCRSTRVRTETIWCHFRTTPSSF